MGTVTPKQLKVLRIMFESFGNHNIDRISIDAIPEILSLMGQTFDKKILDQSIEKINPDEYENIDFDQFIMLVSQFIVEEDDEAMYKELKRAFLLHKRGKGRIENSKYMEMLKAVSGEDVVDDAEEADNGQFENDEISS